MRTEPPRPAPRVLSATSAATSAPAPSPLAPPGRLTRWRPPRWLGPVAVLALLALALVVLRRELAGVGYARISRAVRATPAERLALAGALTALAYAVLAGYDALALAYVRLRFPLRRVVATSTAAYAISQTLGFAAVTGNAVRYRFWSAWGLSAAEIGQAAAFVGATFTVGLVAVCGLALTLEPAGALGALGVPTGVARALGVLLLGTVAAYVGWAAVRRGRPLSLRGWRLPVPGPALAAAQLGLAAVDWAVAASVLRVLLPPTPGLGFVSFAGAFVIAQCVGLLSHVPGGVGVFDALMVVLLRPVLDAEPVLAALVVYRGVYYLLPFGLAVAALGAAEARLQRERLGRLGATAGAVGTFAVRWVPAVLPTALANAVFLAGTVLLWSGATPSVPHRVLALSGVLPLGVIELSHFAGSVAGVALLLLAWAIHRRLDAAYGLTLAVLGAGAAASLLKGFDYEEALVLAAVAAVVAPARGAFYRRAALTSEPPTPAWVAAAVAVVGASVWLGLFSYQHVEYVGDLWWRFAVRGDAPRFLRASAGAVVALGVAGALRLLRDAAVPATPPSAADLARAATAASRSADTLAHVALLGDKALVFDDEGDGFVMYGIAGRSWIALGDPVVPAGLPAAAAAARRAALAWRFREEADRHGAWPVFYQAGAEQLPLYIDLGLALLKLGEEAHVPLARYADDALPAKWMRRALKEAERHGLRFTVVDDAAVPALLPALRAVSDDWLEEKRTREKGFSLGRFDAAYVARFPAALVHERTPGGERLVAFANLWLGASGTELAPDLMRHVRDAPRGTMDFLFVELLRWGAARGYARANLGMAPLSGLEARRLAPLWARAGALVAARGEPVYNFRGLRAFKEKFDPVWVPRYLASPGGLALPRVLANVAAVIAGGLAGVVRR